MTRYHITADVTVSVTISVEAETADDARNLFEGNISLNASLVDVSEDIWDVEEDAIVDIEQIKVEME